MVWTCTAKLGNHFPADEVVQIGDRDYAGQNRVIQADENPNVWRKGIWIPRQCYKPDYESECVSTLEPIRCCRREREDTRCQGFQNLDVTGVAMVPYELEAPGAMVPNVSLCRDEHLLLVTK